jgi:hypothetical protein
MAKVKTMADCEITLKAWHFETAYVPFQSRSIGQKSHMARLEFFEAKKNGLLRGMDTHLSEE